MKGKDQELAELKKETAKKIEAIENKYKVLDALGIDLDGYEEPWIHYHGLYGAVGSIHFSPCKYESLRKGKDPDRALCSALMKKFPPLRKVKIKDGTGTSFPARSIRAGEKSRPERRSDLRVPQRSRRNRTESALSGHGDGRVVR